MCQADSVHPLFAKDGGGGGTTRGLGLKFGLKIEGKGKKGQA